MSCRSPLLVVCREQGEYERSVAHHDESYLANYRDAEYGATKAGQAMEAAHGDNLIHGLSFRPSPLASRRRRAFSLLHVLHTR